MLHHVRLACALVCALAVLLATPSAPVVAADKPRIGDTQVVDAPTGKRGALMTPYVACSSYTIEPRVKTVIEGLSSDYRAEFEYVGTYPGYGFPRVRIGKYEVITTARCGSAKATRVETVRVREKTAKRTISRAEFRRVKRGMTRARVKKIVGYDGRSGGFYMGKTSRTYDMMPFWAISIIEYRKGRVVAKHWRVDHD